MIPNNWDDREELQGGWEKLVPKKNVPKVRKPPVAPGGFGFDSETSESDTDTEADWEEVDTSKKKELKLKERRRKRKELEHATAAKAARMIGIGPIDIRALVGLKAGKIYEEAKIQVAREFLKENLEFEDDELDELNFVETRLVMKEENIIYLALEEQEQVRQIHIRKSEVRNDSIIIRDYIPPNFYQRVKHLNSVCTARRAEDKSLKTQLRFGRKDIEIFTKYKGDDGPFKKVRIDDFTDGEAVPLFDHSVKWRKFEDKPPRRGRLEGPACGQRERQQLPPQQHPVEAATALPKPHPVVEPVQATNPLVRQHSDSSNSSKIGNEKKAKLSSKSSSDDDMDDSSDDSHTEATVDSRKKRTPTKQ